MVYNYDEEGIHRDETGWEQCISIPLVQPDMFELLEQWDKLLEGFSVREAWLPHRCAVVKTMQWGFQSGMRNWTVVLGPVMLVVPGSFRTHFANKTA